MLIRWRLFDAYQSRRWVIPQQCGFLHLERGWAMSTVYEFFSQDHRRCDELFVDLEQALGGGDWGLIEQRVGGFVSEMEHHFFMEEEELFPELEAQFAGAVGPTRMMRIEHRQMRSLFEQLQQCTERKNARDCQDVAETLLMTMQQHNAKEEGVLYPMADNVLGDAAQELTRTLAEAP